MNTLAQMLHHCLMEIQNQHYVRYCQCLDWWRLYITSIKSVKQLAPFKYAKLSLCGAEQTFLQIKTFMCNAIHPLTPIWEQSSIYIAMLRYKGIIVLNYQSIFLTLLTELKFCITHFWIFFCIDPLIFFIFLADSKSSTKLKGTPNMLGK